MRRNLEKHVKHASAKQATDLSLFDTFVLIRLVLATVVFSASLILKLPVFLSVGLLAASALIAGYDIIINAINAVEAKDFFAVPLVLVVITVLSFVIGFGIEGAALILLYQIGMMLLAYVEDRTKRSAMELVKYQDEETVAQLKENLSSRDSCKTELEETMRFCSGRVLKLAMIIAVVYAIIIPLVTSYSYIVSIHRALTIILISTPVSVVVSIPLSAYVAMCYSAQEGVIFKSASGMEKADHANIAVFDKSGVFSSSEARVLSYNSDVLDNETFMEFVAHAVYYSDQPIAKAVSDLEDREYKLEVISEFEEIPGYGVKLKIGSADVALATAEYFNGRGVAVPHLDSANGITYYLVVSNRYVGNIVISSDISTDNASLCDELSECGIGRSILFTDDSNVVGQRIAEDLNFKEVYSELDSDKKLQILEDLGEGRNNRILYVYAEGCESHTAADVDMRVGTKSRYADVVVHPDSLANSPFALQVCRRMREVATFNAVFVFLVKTALIFLSIVGYCNIWFAIFIDMAAAIASVLASFRVTQNSFINDLRYKMGKN